MLITRDSKNIRRFACEKLSPRRYLVRTLLGRPKVDPLTRNCSQIQTIVVARFALTCAPADGPLETLVIVDCRNTWKTCTERITSKYLMRQESPVKLRATGYTGRVLHS